MHAPITVNYVPDGKDWRVTVTDEEQTQNATASGLIAARDQADQIVEKMVPNQTGRTVVHLLEGDAVAFTHTYLQVRLGLTPAPTEAADDKAASTRADPTPATPDDSVPNQTVPAPSSPAPSSAAPGTSAPSVLAAVSQDAATPAPASVPSPTDPTDNNAPVPQLPAPAPAAEVSTPSPLPTTEGDKEDQLTEVAGSSGNQVN
jgi:hypothetical protein